MHNSRPSTSSHKLTYAKIPTTYWNKVSLRIFIPTIYMSHVFGPNLHWDLSFYNFIFFIYAYLKLWWIFCHLINLHEKNPTLEFDTQPNWHLKDFQFCLSTTTCGFFDFFLTNRYYQTIYLKQKTKKQVAQKIKSISL